MLSRRIKKMKKAPVSRRYPLISAALLLLVIVIAMTAGVYAEDDRFESLRELPVVEREDDPLHNTAGDRNIVRQDWTNGDNGRLMADESITREQMAAIITRFAGLMK